MVEERVTLSAGEFHYVDRGQGDPVVCLHALGRQAVDWAGVFDRLAADYRCLAFDQRGHGSSPRCDTYSFDLLADDAHEFVDALGLDRFALLGHSMGANVAWRLAARLSDRVTRLVIEDTAPPSPEQTYDEPPVEAPEGVDFDWEAARGILPELNVDDWRYWDEVAELPMPVLLIAGSPDHPLHGLVGRLPDARIAEIHAGHWIHETEPDAYLELVRDFLLGGAGLSQSS